MDSPRIWSSGVARRSMMGNERTHNPSPAAHSLLGKRAVKRAKAKLKKRGRRRAHKGNPLPAVVGVLSGLGGLAGKLGGRFRKPSEVRAAQIAPSIIQAANGGNLTAAAGLIARAAHPMKVAEAAVWQQAVAQLSPAIIAAVKTHAKSIPAASQKNPEEFAQSVLASPVQLPGAAAGAAAGALGQYGQLLTPGVVTAVARAAGGRSRSRRQRYPTYVDRYGRQRYSTKPPGSQLRLPAGASIAEGTPYNFFTGAVGGGSKLQTAGQLGVAAAVGTAAYFATRAVLRHFSGRALAAEEGGVQAALAFREARKEFADAHGRPPTPDEVREMGAAYKAQLAKLGYDAHGVRTRTATEKFLSDYNPDD